MVSADNDEDAVAPPPVRVGLLAGHRATVTLQPALERCGLRVEPLPPLPAGLQALDGNGCRVFLVDLANASDAAFDVLDEVLERAPGPVVFNDSDEAEQTGVWLRRLAGKLTELARTAPPAPPAAGRPSPMPLPHTPAEGHMAWVLGASFGGPEAVRRFFAALPGAPEAVFFLAQHIGDGFVDLLVSQINRATALNVTAPGEGLQLEPGTVYVAPVNRAIRIDADGRISLERDAVDTHCRPSIDGLMREVAAHYGPRSGAIVFSGMGDDGALGVRAIAAAGGEVWAQDASSSAVSSMPECAAATGTVSRRGTPEELARGLAAFLGQGAGESAGPA